MDCAIFEIVDPRLPIAELNDEDIESIVDVRFPTLLEIILAS
ncbi:MAG: hypothetical protein QW101_07535 [Ignisphaera sp.]